MYMLHLYNTYTDNLFCQGHDSAPGLDIMLLKQQHLSVSGHCGQDADPARQHPPVEYVYRSSHPLLQFLPQTWFSSATVADSSPDLVFLDLVFFSPFEDLRLRTAGIMESKGIHRVYEPSPVPTLYVRRVDTWLWNFGRPQPRVGGLSVAKTEKIRRKSRSEASKRGWATKRARK
jgi:hypothetical protein